MRVKCLTQEHNTVIPWPRLKAKAHNSLQSCTLLLLVKPSFPDELEATEQKTFKGKDVSFECAAKGFPLEVEWKVKRKYEDTLLSCISKFD